MPKRRLKFTFEPQLIKNPVIYELGHRFEIVTNIRMADVDETTGWVILELEGENNAIEEGISWAEEQGIRIDPLPGDIIEG
tara:strand:+ start:49 stop:291 length:243 start_codon:yes stop_codon:yes gene_type:complete